MNKEHFISRNILKLIVATRDPPVLRLKAPHNIFGRAGEIPVGVDSFASKVLCNRHNAALTNLDEDAGRTFRGFMDVEHCLLQVNRGESADSFHLASGLTMERWLIKVYCGLAAARMIRSVTGKRIEAASWADALLPALMGVSPLPPPLGLYSFYHVGQQIGGMRFAPIQVGDGTIGGLLLNLGLMSLALITSVDYGTTFREENWHYHPKELINIRQDGSRQLFIFTY